jgi:hypothetical protein
VNIFSGKVHWEAIKDETVSVCLCFAVASTSLAEEPGFNPFSFISDVIDTANAAAGNTPEKRQAAHDRAINTKFTPGVDTEEYVRSIHDATAKLDDEMLFQDVTPQKKY